jgi:hypothetical protein
MKTHNFTHLTKTMIFILVFVLVLFSCNKSSDNPKGPTQIKYCGQLDWKDTFGAFKLPSVSARICSRIELFQPDPVREQASA